LMCHNLEEFKNCVT